MSSIFEAGAVLNGIVKLLEFQDRGGQGEIWSVSDVTYQEHTNLALKLRYVEWERRSEETFLKADVRLKEEVRLLGGCRNRYIVAPHFLIGGRETVNDKDYAISGLVMDLATEGNLARFRSHGAYSTFSALDRYKLLEHLALGLQALQHFNIIHNDIKPPNILVNNEAGHFIPKYADFGYAFQHGDTVIYGGTPAYMAPELVLKTADPSFESDIYSLGMTFYELLLGHHPLEHILSHGDQLQALIGYYPTHEYIDSGPLGDLNNKALTELIQQMCCRAPEGRPPLTEILEVLQNVTHEARSRESIRPEDLYPQIANRFRWSEVIHGVFGETEQVYFIRGTRPEFDAMFLAEQLTQARIFGYSILRLLGSSDYMLRVWRRDADKGGLEDVFRRYRSERGEFEVFTPTLRQPRPGKTVEARYGRQSDTLTLLQKLLEGGDPGVVDAARKSGAIAGESKLVRERGKTRNAIRAICRLRAKKVIPVDLAAVVAEKAYAAACGIKGLREIEVLGNPGREGSPAEFLLIAELDKFHDYSELVRRVERTVTGLVGGDSIDEFRTHFEMDAVPTYESYDGRLLYELYRHRPRRLTRDDAVNG